MYGHSALVPSLLSINCWDDVRGGLSEGWVWSSSETACVICCVAGVDPLTVAKSNLDDPCIGGPSVEDLPVAAWTSGVEGTDSSESLGGIHE